MLKRGLLPLLGLLSLTLAVSLACASLVSEPTEAPPPKPAEIPPPTENAATSGADWKTFTDQNNYLAIDVPADSEYSQTVDTENNYWYWDVLASPDGHAKIESVVFDDGTAWTGSSSGKQALYMLHEFYSSTGEEGDVRISNDSIQKDGSERLTWASRGGNYSGISFFEVRDRTTFLMFTVWWDDEYADQYGDILDQVIDSYRVP